MGLFWKRKEPDIISIFNAPEPAEVKLEPAGPETSETDVQANFYQRFKRAVSSTRENLVEKIENVVKGKKEIDAQTLDELEEILIGSDIGVATTMEIIEKVRKQVDRASIKDVDELKRQIRQELEDILEASKTKSGGVASETSVADTIKPYVIMV